VDLQLLLGSLTLLCWQRCACPTRGANKAIALIPLWPPELFMSLFNHDVLPFLPVIDKVTQYTERRPGRSVREGSCKNGLFAHPVRELGYLMNRSSRTVLTLKYGLLLDPEGPCSYCDPERSEACDLRDQCHWTV
jgi:hypothetical protein